MTTMACIHRHSRKAVYSITVMEYVGWFHGAVLLIEPAGYILEEMAHTPNPNREQLKL